jgi:predicted nucleic acid-binding protein
VIVVGNTSPLTNLAAVGQLDLLRQLYGKVLIPQAVYGELTGSSGGQPGAIEMQPLEWIETRPGANRALVTALQMELDAGEAEAIVLAKELAADLLLLDERRGRAVVARLDLRFVGLLGVLIEAKKLSLYGDGKRAAINLASERKLLLLIDDWRPYEAARAAGVEVANTPAYLVQLYHKGRLSLERVLGDFAKLARRGTLKPEWLQAALKVITELQKKGKSQ